MNAPAKINRALQHNAAAAKIRELIGDWQDANVAYARRKGGAA
tara:strand:+ start:42 stop:170 length:129 start_codon:yes stop_codon:yes gene_type:complete